jgi:hypothetical protein
MLLLVQATISAHETELRIIDHKLSQIADVADEITKVRRERSLD